MHEACGICGIYAPGDDVARLAYFGLYALQHRGQESAGIATADGERLHIYTEMGLVAQVFNERILSSLPGHISIGHTRYSTTGSSRQRNSQPIMIDGPHEQMAIAHNGNVINAGELRQELLEQGIQFTTSTDSEVVGYLIATSPGRDWPERIRAAMRRFQGAYCLVILTRDSLFAVRDPLGVRPLCLGRINGDWVIASESCALAHIGATLCREIEPGEIVSVDATGMRSFPREEQGRRAICMFEYIYLARPDSVINGRLLYPARLAMGAMLAREHNVEADLVIGVPDSATAAAIGYAQESGIQFSDGLVKNRYVGRTFIQPDQRL
ncbi:MAG: amidophosphoribosyltransferase, partial [Chloroflexi bacterium]|nr:amidophosphoribosyltransferase [Chloroflexota bacterium]